MRKAYKCLAWLDQLMALTRKKKKSNLDNEDYKDPLSIINKETNPSKKKQMVKRKAAIVNWMMIQRSLCLLLLPQIVPKRI